MALIIPRSSVGTVQLMLLNLLQAVVIMADISLLRVTKSREGNFARPPWLILCQAVHCWDNHRACQRWALESLRSEWGQYGHPLKCLGKDQRCLLETVSGLSPRAEGTFIPTRSEENPGREEGLLPQLAPESKQTKPYCCSECCLWGDPALPRATRHERGVFWTPAAGSGTSNRGFLLGLRYMLTLEVLSPQSRSLTRHLLDCLQGLLEISCVLLFFNRVLISIYFCSYLQ